MKTGLILGESIDAYHASPALSHSKLEDFRKLPALYYGRHVTKTIPRRKKTDAMDVGNALDAILLEGAAGFQRKVAILAPDHNGRTNEGKAMVSMLQRQGKTILTHQEGLLVEEMLDAAMKHPEASALLSKGTPQVTFRHDFGFAHIQCRPEWWNPEGIVLNGVATGPYHVELKSARSLDKADFGNFERTFLDKHYHRQIALYREVIREVLIGIAGEKVPYVRTYMIVVDKNEVVCCQVFEPTQRTLDEARNEVINDLDQFERCVRRNEWPSRPTGVLPLDLPEWYFKRKAKEEAA